jgi:hypothetical protein
LVCIIQYIAERNLAFRESVDILHNQNNGNFLKEVDLLVKFDPVLEECVRRIDSGGNHFTYLGKIIQNELINKEIFNTIVSLIK